MEHLNFLQSFKDNLKKEVATDLEKSLEMLFSVLNKQSPARNELLALEGRFNQVKSESLKSIISYDTRTLAINQIRNGAIEFVEQLEYKDLDSTFSPELKTNIDAFNAAAIPVKLESKFPLDAIKPESESETFISSSPQINEDSNPKKETPQKPQAGSSNPDASPLSIPEYEIFVAQHQATLKTFPRVFRRAREISIRRDMNSATDFHQAIQTHLVTLQKFETLLAPIRENIKQIRLDRNNEIYWLQYKMIKEVPETVESDSLEILATALPKLESLYESLDKLNLI